MISSNAANCESSPVLFKQSSKARELLMRLENEFKEFLELDDTAALRVSLGTHAANFLHNEPVWTLIVSPPSTAKTEFVCIHVDYPHSHSLSNLTEAGLISGTSRKDSDLGSTGGVLMAMGSFGIILVKDLTTLLSRPRDTQNQVFGALREIYDGKYDKATGAGGGRIVSWIGKAGFIGAVTPEIDKHHAVLSKMGPRFLLHRLPSAADRDDEARKALSRTPLIEAKRHRLREMTHSLLDSIDRSDVIPPALPGWLNEKMVSLARLVAIGRTPVDRGNDRNISFVHSPEGPARVIQQLRGLLIGQGMIGARFIDAWTATVKTAFSSIPEIRYRTLDNISRYTTMSTADVARELTLPRSSTEKILQDMAAIGMLAEYQSSGQGTNWVVSKLLATTLAEIRAPLPTDGMNREVELW